MMVYSRIVLAYDGSTYAATALHQAAGLARVCGSELHLLGCVSTNGGLALAQAAGPGDVWGMEQRRLKHALELAAKSIVGECSKLFFAMREGDPAAEIVAYARSIHADLAVIGHSDRGVLARWFRGSTSERMLRDLPCNLLIVTNP
jgi:nucleotide-binding universal stress UspA family protein